MLETVGNNTFCLPVGGVPSTQVAQLPSQGKVQSQARKLGDAVVPPKAKKLKISSAVVVTHQPEATGAKPNREKGDFDWIDTCMKCCFCCCECCEMALRH